MMMMVMATKPKNQYADGRDCGDHWPCRGVKEEEIAPFLREFHLFFRIMLFLLSLCLVAGCSNFSRHIVFFLSVLPTLLCNAMCSLKYFAWFWCIWSDHTWSWCIVQCQQVAGVRRPDLGFCVDIKDQKYNVLFLEHFLLMWSLFIVIKKASNKEWRPGNSRQWTWQGAQPQANVW